MKEFRSIKSLIIDESSGLSVALTPASQQIELFSPDYYNIWYETPLMDGNVPAGGLQFIQPNGKDVLELKEVYPNGGVSINAIDTDTDGIVDSIELYNPLIDGGLIEGTITLNGELYVNGTDADGSEVQSIPFRWQKVFSDLVYSLRKMLVLIQCHHSLIWMLPVQCVQKNLLSMMRPLCSQLMLI